MRAADSAAERPAMTPAPGAKILMVDDHPGNLLALEAILGPLGYEMVRANSADEAFRHLIDGEFAVILMDVQMPGTDGFAAASLIKKRERTRAIPIIFITALSRDTSFVYQGYEHGAVDYILKPVEPMVLRSKVAVFVELFLQRQQIRDQGRLVLEQDQQRSERRYRALSDSMPMALWVTDRGGKLLYCNQRMLESCGMSQATLEKIGWQSCILDEDRARMRAAWDRAVATGRRQEVEFRLQTAGGSAYRWQLGSIAPDSEDAGGWIFVAADISTQKAAQDEVERASRLKDDFLATVSHELRTPLNAILGWSQTLLESALSPEQTRTALEAIERNARAQSGIIADILDVSRIITGKLGLTLEELHVGPIAQSAIEVVRAAAQARSIEISTSIADEHQVVYGDASRLTQILWNLLSNAVKFTNPGGRVKLSVRKVGDELDMTVEDNGQGISPTFMPYVFDRFRQADSSSTRAHGGLGLGLAIVKHLCELQGGSVRAHSDGEGKGSRFVVRLPLRSATVSAAQRPMAPAADPTQSSDSASLSGRKILVVDDDTDARELIELVFARKGAEVVAARSVADAFARLDQFHPDLIVSDIGMPDEDGYALVRRLRTCGSATERTPAIALTGFARSDDGRRALDAGFQAHVPKPVEPAKLLALVQSILAMR